MARLCLHLLGAPRIEIDGEPIQVDTRKATALLAYVAVKEGSHRRESLVNLLWPGSDRAHGRAALRRTLYTLRTALAAGGWLDVDRETVRLVQGAEVEVDVGRFQELLAECRAHGHSDSDVCSDCLSALAGAARLYRGDFLAGFTLRDSFNFDDWQFFQAESLRREFASVLDRLVRLLVDYGEFNEAIRHARRWVALDRLEEQAHYQLMRLYDWSGHRAAALRQYEQCSQVLESQLGVAPQPATTVLYDAIRGNRALPCRRLPVDRVGETLFRCEPAGSVPTRTAAGAGRIARSDEATASRGVAPVGEVRLATVLCVVLGPSASCASPEAEAKLAQRCVEAVRRGAEKRGGTVERTLGGAVVATFGVHESRESDAELAVRAGIEIVGDVGEPCQPIAVGIQTGQVIAPASDDDRMVSSALLSNVAEGAARLARCAGPGTVLVDELTQQLSRGAFQYAPLIANGTKQAGHRTVFRVERMLPRTRKARGIDGMRAELVGRDGELGQLLEALAAALSGSGGMVSIIGDAGVGKSRMVEELRQTALHGAGNRRAPYWLEGRCMDVGASVGYAPFVDMFRTHFGWGARETDRRRFARIRAALESMTNRSCMAIERAREVTRMLASLLALSVDGEWRTDAVLRDPSRLHVQTFTAVRDYLRALALERPTVLVFEDIHWSDSVSLDLITVLMEDIERAPLLLICTYRPEPHHRSAHLATIASQKCGERYLELRLSELSRADSRRLIRSALGSEEVAASLEDLVLAKCQGNPFFIEEMLRVLVDEGLIVEERRAWQAAEHVASAGVPESVQSVIQGRVGRLEASCRRVLETASVIGCVFPQRVLEMAIDEATDLEQALWELEDRALVFQERTIPEVEHSFRHVLLRDVVYQTMLEGRRKALHATIADAIERLYAANLEEHCEELALHRERSGEAAAAVDHLLEAARKARRSYANEEAIAHLTKALALLASQPASPERDRRELDLRLALGVPLVHSRGHSDPGVREVYRSARDLATEVGTGGQVLDALFGLRRYHLARGEMTIACGVSAQAVSLAQDEGDRLAIVFAHMLHAETCYWMGRFSLACDEAEQSLVRQDPSARQALALRYGNDCEAGGHIYRALALWQLGHADRARRTMADARELAQSSQHPFTQAFALCFSARLSRLCGEGKLARAFTDSLVRLSDEHNFALYSAAGQVLRAQICAKSDPDDVAVRRLRDAIAAWRELGIGMWLTEYAVTLAEALGCVGSVEAGLEVLDRGLQRVEDKGERCYLAEMHRIKGELLLKRGDSDARARGCFERALTVARDQGSRAWELRAAAGLARLMHAQGKTGEARQLLQPIHVKFTEGFDTVDLRGAKELLDALL